MKNIKSFSNIIENIYTTALEVNDEARKDGIFELKNLSIELSVLIEQKLTYSREVVTKACTKSTSCSDGVTRKDDTFSSQIKITFVPRNYTFDQNSV